MQSPLAQSVKILVIQLFIYMHQYFFKLRIAAHKMIENNFSLNHYCFPRQVDAYHHRRCATEKYLEKFTSQSFSTLLIRKPTVQHCLKSCFEKNKLTTSRKTNTQF